MGREIVMSTSEEVRARLRRRHRARYIFFAAALGFFVSGIAAFATRETEAIPLEWLVVLQFALWAIAVACLLYLSNVPCPACGKPFHARRDAGTLSRQPRRRSANSGLAPVSSEMHKTRRFCHRDGDFAT
jgi:hypothetical protein